MNILISTILYGTEGIEHGFGTKTAGLSKAKFASLRQIHSAKCLTAHETGCAGDGDALITNRAGLAVSIRTADCLPILIADPARKAVAAVHAGWRGTEARIVLETIRRMASEFGTEPRDLVAAIGPGIGVCCYEVGEDVGRKFGLSGAGRVDLAAENHRQLIEAGVEQIDVMGLCTFCDQRFHSWRRDGERAGRMISFIKIS